MRLSAKRQRIGRYLVTKSGHEPAADAIFDIDSLWVITNQGCPKN
jgi:Fe2+ or Zn2+ uptake regulation protein